MKTKKSWTEKLHQAKKPEVKVIDFAFADIPANSKMLIATPKIIDDYVKQIPKGKSVDMLTLRNDLALAHHAACTCPLTTGIFLRIAAEAAYEQYLQHQELHNITPFWRVIEPHSKMAKKLTCGIAFIEEERNKEGIAINKVKPKKTKKATLK